MKGSSPGISIVAALTILSLLFLQPAYGETRVTPQIIDSLYAKSKTFWYTNRDSSIFYLRQVEKFSNFIDYARGKGYANYGLGWHEHVLFRRFQYLTNALEWFEKSNDLLGKAVTLTFIGDVYSTLGEHDKFREYTLRSLDIKKQINDYGGIAQCYINLGKDLQHRRLYPDALENYKEALTYRLKENRQQGIAYAEVNVADVYLETGNYEEALRFAKKAYADFLPSKDAGGILWSASIIGSSYLKLNKIDSARITLEAIINNANGTQFDHIINNAQKNLVQVYTLQKDIQKAFAIQSQYIITRDRLDSWNQDAETLRVTKEYEFKMAEKEAARQKEIEENEISRRNTIEYLTITVIVALFFIILFSGKKWLKGNLIKVFTFIALLLLFEFLLVITDPTVESLTQGDPLLKLLANVILALLIFPCHRLLENFTKKRLLKPAEVA